MKTEPRLSLQESQARTEIGFAETAASETLLEEDHAKIVVRKKVIDLIEMLKSEGGNILVIGIAGNVILSTFISELNVKIVMSLHQVQVTDAIQEHNQDLGVDRDL